MKTKHTPGQWSTGAMLTRVEVYPKGWRIPMLIADCHGKCSPPDEAERVANARLIAAAPKLLEDLFAASSFLKYHHGTDPRTKNFCAMLDRTIHEATHEDPV